LTNLVYSQHVNVVLDSSMVYPHWYSVPLSNEFPTVVGIIEVPSPMNNVFSLCLPENYHSSGNTIGFGEASQSWIKIGDMPIKLVIEKITDTIPTVEFNCNMSVQMKRGTFAATDSVWVRGNFNDWAGKAFLLTDPDGDSVYSGLYNNFTVGQNLVFKYVHSPDAWEATGNRTLTVGVGPNFTSVYWEDVSVYKQTKTIQVTFTVNMELPRLFGLFNSQTDSVAVRGSFNGWGETVMKPISANSDTFRVVAPIVASVDEQIDFKFFYSPGTWEDNNLTDNDHQNRYFIVSQSNYDSGFIALNTFSFNNNCPFCPFYYRQKVKITCNTNGARILNTPTGTEFQTVHIFGVPSEEFNIEKYLPDSVKSIQLFDNGINGDAVAGDKIFSVDTVLTFAIYDLFPQSFIISYKYSANYNLPTNGGTNDNEAIGEGYHKSYFQPYPAVITDTFGIVNITKVEQENLIPSVYKLEQNYPNPFNPETKISWQIAVGSFVSLKIYDVLGNEVATLVNEEQSAGTYQVTFNPQLTTNHQQLSSGIYFYQLRAGDFIQTKKMILLR